MKKNYSLWETMAYGVLRQFPKYRTFADGMYKVVGWASTIYLGFKAGEAVFKYLDAKLQEQHKED